MKSHSASCGRAYAYKCIFAYIYEYEYCGTIACMISEGKNHLLSSPMWYPIILPLLSLPPCIILINLITPLILLTLSLQHFHLIRAQNDSYCHQCCRNLHHHPWHSVRTLTHVHPYRRFHDS